SVCVVFCVYCFFFFTATALTYFSTLSLHDALPICLGTRLPIANQFVVRTELANISYIETDKWRGFHKGVLRIMPSFSLGKRVEIFAGPTLNVDYYESDSERNYFDKKHLFKSYGDDEWVSMRVGYVAGVQFVF